MPNLESIIKVIVEIYQHQYFSVVIFYIIIAIFIFGTKQLGINIAFNKKSKINLSPDMSPGMSTIMPILLMVIRLLFSIGLYIAFYFLFEWTSKQAYIALGLLMAVELFGMTLEIIAVNKILSKRGKKTKIFEGFFTEVYKQY